MRKLTLFIVVVSILALLASSACSSDDNGDNGGGDNSHELIIAVSGNGSTSPSAGSNTYNEGDVVTINATPDPGWQFVNWTGNVADTNSASTTVTMNGDETVTAIFTKITAAEQWAAYAFNEAVYPASGDSGTVKSFTIEVTYGDGVDTRQFQIESEYLGIETDAEIKTQKIDYSNPLDPATTNVTTSMDCYKIKHHITVLQAPAEDDNPEWADVTVWIPTTEFETTTNYFWIYPKAVYNDSNANTGEWSYYLTQAMQDEMEGGTVFYLPHVDGEFHGFDQWALYGFYGWAWMWFSPYATGGDEYLEEGSWSVGGYSYSVTSESIDIGSYTFDAWSVTIDLNQAGGYEGTFSPDLPVPIYLKVGSSQFLFECELTELVLE